VMLRCAWLAWSVSQPLSPDPDFGICRHRCEGSGMGCQGADPSRRRAANPRNLAEALVRIITASAPLASMNRSPVTRVPSSSIIAPDRAGSLLNRDAARMMHGDAEPRRTCLERGDIGQSRQVITVIGAPKGLGRLVGQQHAALARGHRGRAENPRALRQAEVAGLDPIGKEARAIDWRAVRPMCEKEGAVSAAPTTLFPARSSRRSREAARIRPARALACSASNGGSDA